MGADVHDQSDRVRVLIVDDHPVVRAGVRSLLEASERIEVVGEAGTATEAVDRCAALRPTLVAMDLRLRGESGADATRIIRERCPWTKVLILTSYGGDEEIHRAIDAGARGYVLKDTATDELIAAVLAVAAGKHHIPAEVSRRLAAHGPRISLTTREHQVLGLMAVGLRNKEIAEAVGVTEATARTHVQNILSKFDCSDRGRAVAIAITRGFLDGSPLAAAE